MASRYAFLLLCLICAASLANANRCRRKDCRAVKRRDGDSIALAAEKRDLCSCTCGPEGKTILHLSGPEECVVCANALLTASQNCAVDVTDYNDDTPLHDAASDCQSPMTNVFLDHGADPNAIDYDGYSPLCLAALNSEEKCGGVVQDLINKGAYVCQTCRGYYPIDLATNQVVIDIFKKYDGDKCP